MSLGPDCKTIVSMLKTSWLEALQDGVIEELTAGNEDGALVPVGDRAARALLAIGLHQALVALDTSGRSQYSLTLDLCERLESLSRSLPNQWADQALIAVAKGYLPSVVQDGLLHGLDRLGRSTRSQLAERCQMAIALHARLVADDISTGSNMAGRMLAELRGTAVFA